MADCRNCEFGGRPTYEWPCHICTVGSAFKQKPKPTTNADRIRAMSDEELAKKFCELETSGMIYGPSGKAHWLNWLQSPAGGEFE